MSRKDEAVRPMHKGLLVVMCLLPALGLTGCGNSEYPMPRGIGGHPADLKASPCACVELPLKNDDPDARDRLRAVIRAVADT